MEFSAGGLPKEPGRITFGFKESLRQGVGTLILKSTKIRFLLAKKLTINRNEFHIFARGQVHKLIKGLYYEAESFVRGG
jgi:hypothetical protein